MITLITLAKFISDVEKGLISEIFSITVGTEKRVYGKTREGNLRTTVPFKIVYAVVT